MKNLRPVYKMGSGLRLSNLSPSQCVVDRRRNDVTDVCPRQRRVNICSRQKSTNISRFLPPTAFVENGKYLINALFKIVDWTCLGRQG